MLVVHMRRPTAEKPHKFTESEPHDSTNYKRYGGVVGEGTTIQGPVYVGGSYEKIHWRIASQMHCK